MGYSKRFTPQGTIAEDFTSHEGIDHDRLSSFGYDWEQVGRPDIPPVYPSKIYLPRTTEDVIAAIREVKQLGQRLTIRSRGHSSNDLVLTTGPVLSTTRLNQLLSFDEASMTATVQAGIVSADLDEFLAARGYGLPVIGDHNDITVGGFSSVGGIGPASFRHGMFVDTVVSFEYVTFDGELIACSRDRNADQFWRVLCGTGQYGVIVTMTCRFIRIDKYHTVLRNNRRLHFTVDGFIRDTAPLMRDPRGQFMIRAAWNDLGPIRIGQVSPYVETTQSSIRSLRDKVVYGYLHWIGRRAGTLPPWSEKVFKGLGTVGILIPPRYATIKNVEFFSDRIVDSTVGDPTRWFILLVPGHVYEVMFRAVYQLGLEYRDRFGCFSFVCIYVKAFRSDYLSTDPAQFYCEMNLLLGITKRGVQPDEIDALVSRLDDLCIEHRAFRYMHTRTVKDPARRQRIDANAALHRAVEASGIQKGLTS